MRKFRRKDRQAQQQEFWGRPEELVDAPLHNAWHKKLSSRFDGGKFNKSLKDFFRLNENATAEQILAHLTKIRQGEFKFP